MKTSALWAIAAVLAGAVGVHGSCLAGEKGQPGPGNPIALLAGSAVPTAELGRVHARGATNIDVTKITNDIQSPTGGDGASISAGALRGNAVIGSSATGMITTSDSVNNNMGITTVFQNSGNNSLFQSSTAITITVH
jgi:hypothetical protein